MDVCLNPYLESTPSIPAGITSNCMSCHGTARIGDSGDYLPNYSAPIDFFGDAAYFNGNTTPYGFLLGHSCRAPGRTRRSAGELAALSCPRRRWASGIRRPLRTISRFEDTGSSAFADDDSCRELGETDGRRKNRAAFTAAAKGRRTERAVSRQQSNATAAKRA